MSIIFGIIILMILILGLFSTKLVVTVNELFNEVESYQTQIQVKDTVIKRLNTDYASLDNKYKNLLKDYENLTEEYEELKKKGQSKEKSLTSLTPLKYDTGFRSWMPYTAITDSSSLQYKVVHMANVNSEGILTIDDKVVVAIGTGWNVSIGDEIIINTDQGTYYAVVGDYKANKDTDKSNKVTTSNGCVVEFIVDKSNLSNKILKTGSVSSVDKYAGKVLTITKTGNNILKSD